MISVSEELMKSIFAVKEKVIKMKEKGCPDSILNSYISSCREKLKEEFNINEEDLSWAEMVSFHYFTSGELKEIN